MPWIKSQKLAELVVPTSGVSQNSELKRNTGFELESELHSLSPKSFGVPRTGGWKDRQCANRDALYTLRKKYGREWGAAACFTETPTTQLSAPSVGGSVWAGAAGSHKSVGWLYPPM